jgi:hypothetical protein
MGQIFPKKYRIFITENISGRKYQVIWVFIDGLLSRSEPSNEVIKQCGNPIHDLGKGGRLTLHTTAGEDNVNIIGCLLNSLEETEHTITFVKLLLT